MPGFPDFDRGQVTWSLYPQQQENGILSVYLSGIPEFIMALLMDGIIVCWDRWLGQPVSKDALLPPSRLSVFRQLQLCGIEGENAFDPCSLYNKF